MGGRMSDERTALAKLASQATATLLRELVAHLRQNRTHLREEWVHRMGLGDRRASRKRPGCRRGTRVVPERTESQDGPSSVSPMLLVHLGSVGTPQKASPRLACPSARLRHPSDAATQTHPVHSNHNENVAGGIRSAFRVSGAISSFVAMRSLGSAPGASGTPLADGRCLATVNATFRDQVRAVHAK